MRTLKTKQMKHKCSVPFCGGLNVTAVTRAGSFASAPPIYLCEACMKELIDMTKCTKKKKQTDASMIENMKRDEDKENEEV